MRSPSGGWGSMVCKRFNGLHLRVRKRSRQWWMSVEVGRMLTFQRTLSASASSWGLPDNAEEDPFLSRALVPSRTWSGTSAWITPPLRVGCWARKRPTLESFLLVCMRLSVDPSSRCHLSAQRGMGRIRLSKGRGTSVVASNQPRGRSIMQRSSESRVVGRRNRGAPRHAFGATGWQAFCDQSRQ